MTMNINLHVEYIYMKNSQVQQPIICNHLLTKSSLLGAFAANSIQWLWGMEYKICFHFVCSKSIKFNYLRPSGTWAQHTMETMVTTHTHTYTQFEDVAIVHIYIRYE